MDAAPPTLAIGGGLPRRTGVHFAHTHTDTAAHNAPPRKEQRIVHIDDDDDE